jgi:S-methylmethionine-dependent homocysteine/selenocysteine methylase
MELTDGGLETTLVFDEGLELECFAAFPLLEHDAGRDALRRYFRPYLELARERGLPFVLGTPTWRANPDWASRLGYGTAEVAAINAEAVAFARELADGYADVTIDGVVGPRGDGYVVGERMSADQARDYHAGQIEALRGAGADRIEALTLTYPEEAVGVARAAADADVPAVVSFTVETDGRLPDGTPLAEAVERVDEETGGSLAFLMVNCAHPTHIAAGLDRPLERIGGLRVNGSPLSHAELDAAEELDADPPADLAREHAELHDALPGIRLLGGCCGTSHHHVAEIAARWPG